MKKRYSEEQIIGFLREADAGLPIKELCRKHGFSEPSYYAWKAKFGCSQANHGLRKRSFRPALRPTSATCCRLFLSDAGQDDTRTCSQSTDDAQHSADWRQPTRRPRVVPEPRTPR